MTVFLALAMQGGRPVPVRDEAVALQQPSFWGSMGGMLHLHVREPGMIP